MSWEAPANFLVVYELDGTVTHIDAREESAIDAGVSAWLASGKTRDSLLHLAMAEGPEYVVLASQVKSWYICTPEFRRNKAVRERFRMDEKRVNFSDVGLPWTDDD